eukprot:TRINITY_DN1588_c0_g2_i1.p1 TRINITY_DN1588_c0_g2~~TRINITY_DN1588_c0_g2_i1.p1  ORF type:complete len:1077 (+),score=392.47 TRINITY_DN1588_c0_g2_i1:163-3393(+)
MSSPTKSGESPQLSPTTPTIAVGMYEGDQPANSSDAGSGEALLAPPVLLSPQLLVEAPCEEGPPELTIAIAPVNAQSSPQLGGAYSPKRGARGASPRGNKVGADGQRKLLSDQRTTSNLSNTSGVKPPDDGANNFGLLTVVRKELGDAKRSETRRSVFAVMAGSPNALGQPSRAPSQHSLLGVVEAGSPRGSIGVDDGVVSQVESHRSALVVTLEQLRDAFTAIDTGGAGTLTEEEVAENLLPQLGIHHFTADDVSALIRELDTDGDGEVNFREFVQFYELLLSSNDKDAAENGSASALPQTGQDLLKKVKDNKQKQKRADAADAYLTERQIKARKRVAEILYDLPCFAPDFVGRRLWDVAVLLCILYCFIVPMVIAALGIEPTTPLFVTDALIYSINVADFLVNCNTAFQGDESFVLTVQRAAIIKNYFMRDLMVIDILCAVPLDHIVWAATQNVLAFRILCCIKILKILKYPKLFHLTNRGTMDPTFVAFYFTAVPLLRLMFKMIVMGHLLAFIRMLLSAHESYAGDEECPRFGRDACSDSAFLKYFYSFYWIWSLLTTQGTVALGSRLSFFYAGCVMFLSLLLQGHVVANMSAIILKSNVEVQNQDAMRGTLAIMRHYKIPALLQQEVLSFQFHSLQQNAAASLAHTLERLPPTMQREVGLYVKVDLVTNVPMFQSISSEGRLSLANCLEQTFAEPYDFIMTYGDAGDAMYFVMHGFADVVIPAPPGIMEQERCALVQDGPPVGKVVATIIRGNFFGEVALLKPELTRTASIQALTYCNLFRLGVDDVRLLFKEYEEIRWGMETEARRRGLIDDAPVQVVVSPAEEPLAVAKAAPAEGEGDAPAKKRTRGLARFHKAGLAVSASKRILKKIKNERKSASSGERSNGERPNRSPKDPALDGVGTSSGEEGKDPGEGRRRRLTFPQLDATPLPVAASSDNKLNPAGSAPSQQRLSAHISDASTPSGGGQPPHPPNPPPAIQHSAVDDAVTRRTLSTLVKAIEQGQDKLARSVQREVKTYLERVDEISVAVDEFLEKLEAHVGVGGMGSGHAAGLHRGSTDSKAGLALARRTSLWM